jgi:hypothetical protein
MLEVAIYKLGGHPSQELDRAGTLTSESTFSEQ